MTAIRHAARLLGGTLLGAALMATGACELLPDRDGDGPRASPFVAMSQGIADAMLRLAGTTPEDIVYDLGSGDGRIPVTAADKFDVRLGVGLETDRALIRMGEDKAREAGVENRVQFIQGDVFRVDISEATVVTLVADGEIDAALRSELLKDLRPGTRIVGHRLGMGDWHPDKSAALRAGASANPRGMERGEFPIHLWIVPARVAGEWRWSTGPGTAFALRLRQAYQVATGEIDIGRGPVPVREARIAGNRLRFEVFDHEGGRDIVVRFDAEVEAATMRGTVTLDGRSVPFSALRAD